MVRRLEIATMAWCVLFCGCATAADDDFPGNSVDEVQQGEGGFGGSGGAPGQVINVSSSNTTTITATSTVTSTVTTGAGGGGCDSGSCESCQQCAMNGVCSSSVDACLSNTECTALWDCLGACGPDDICANGCLDTYPGGFDLFNAVGECVFCTGCPTTCGGC